MKWLPSILAGFAVAGLLVFLVSREAGFYDDVPVRQALVAGTFLAMGWVVTFGLREFGEQSRRAQKSRDIQAAFKAEIFDYSEALEEDSFADFASETYDRTPTDLIEMYGDPATQAEVEDILTTFGEEVFASVAAEIQKKVLDGGDDEKTRYHPLVPRISPPRVFDALAQDISLLPEKVIDDVVQFYSVLSDLSILAEDLMTKTFMEGPAEGRANAVYDFMALRYTTWKLSMMAVSKLRLSLMETERKRLGKVMGVVAYDA